MQWNLRWNEKKKIKKIKKKKKKERWNTVFYQACHLLILFTMFEPPIILFIIKLYTKRKQR